MKRLFWLPVSFALLCASTAAAQYETPPKFKASAILKPEELKSEVYTIDEAVVNDGYMNNFIVKSRFGEYKARGRLTLDNRIHEIGVLDSLEREYPSTKVATDAAYNTGKNIVTAPVRAVSKAVDHVSDTEKLKKLPGSLVGGVVGIFFTAASVAGSGAEYVYESGKGVVTGSSSSTGSGEGTFTQASNFLSNAALDFIGYNKAAKDLMKRYSIDPYTDNAQLRSEVRRIAGITSGVSVAGKFAPGLPSIPLVGSFNHYMGLATGISAYDDPQKLEEISDKVLTKIGATEGRKSGWEGRFKKNPAYTPLTRALLLDNLSKLEGVEGLGNFIELAAEAKDRDGGFFYVSVSRRLLEIHRSKEPLKELISSMHLPGGVTAKGTLYVPLAVDYLVWTKEVATIFRSFRKQLLQKHKVAAGIVEISGGISPRCAKELTALGAKTLPNLGPFLSK